MPAGDPAGYLPAVQRARKSGKRKFKPDRNPALPEKGALKAAHARLKAQDRERKMRSL